MVGVELFVEFATDEGNSFVVVGLCDKFIGFQDIVKGRTVFSYVIFVVTNVAHAEKFGDVVVDYEFVLIVAEKLLEIKNINESYFVEWMLVK